MFNTTYNMDNTYYNLWNSNNNLTTVNNSIVKTIYDPSPRGYAMPPSAAFTGFTTTGNNTGTRNEFNVVGNFDKGWYFKTGYPAPNDKIYFPASGYRNYSYASLVGVGNGYYWTAGPYNTAAGATCLLLGRVYPQNDSNRSRLLCPSCPYY